MSENWRCPKCQALNPPKRSKCWQCGLPIAQTSSIRSTVVEKANNEKLDKKKVKRKRDTTITVAIIGLIGTVITAIFASPVLIALIQRTPTPVPTETIVPSATNLPITTQTSSIAPSPIRLEPPVSGGGCLVIAIPPSISAPAYLDINDPFSRWEETINFFLDKGFQLAFDKVNKQDFVPAPGYYDIAAMPPCQPSIWMSEVIWNNSENRVLIEEVIAVVEAYDYEPSSLPSDYKIVLVRPPGLGGSSGTPIPSKTFSGEIRPTTNALPILASANIAPVVIEAHDTIRTEFSLSLTDSGTYRIHFSSVTAKFHLQGVS